MNLYFFFFLEPERPKIVAQNIFLPDIFCRSLAALAEAAERTCIFDVLLLLSDEIQLLSKHAHNPAATPPAI